MKVTFENAAKYIKSTYNLSQDYDFEVCIGVGFKNISFSINRSYFISVGEFEENVYEVFELHHGAKIVDGDWATDGTLAQFKLYNSLKRAIDYAMKCYRLGYIKDKPIREW